MMTLSDFMLEHIKLKSQQDPTFVAPKSPFSHPCFPKWGPMKMTQRKYYQMLEDWQLERQKRIRAAWYRERKLEEASAKCAEPEEQHSEDFDSDELEEDFVKCARWEQRSAEFDPDELRRKNDEVYQKLLPFVSPKNRKDSAYASLDEGTAQ